MPEPSPTGDQKPGSTPGTKVRVYPRFMTKPRVVSNPARNALTTWVGPDACTLPTVEQPVRAAEFNSLFGDALTSVERASRTSARFALTDGEETAGRAQDLAARETECCSFFTFTITPTGPVSAVMEVTVPEAHADVLAALVDMAEAASQRAGVGGLEA